MAGRFAPSPTGPLHVGNLRTALIAWLHARSSGLPFIVRIEDLDRVQSTLESERQQLADLADLGLDWDGDVLRQSDRFDLYRSAITHLDAAGLVYRCYCTRREIRAEIEAATSAPHVHLPDGAYPGTCRDLTSRARARHEASGRTPALRLRTEGQSESFTDEVAGAYAGAVDDVVLARADGIPAYNLAVVVDDGLQGVSQVVRADDLLSSTPRQMLLQRLLHYPEPAYAHVPLVVDPTGRRLAKRFGAVTMGDLAAEGWTPGDLLGAIATSLDLAAPGERMPLDVVLERFDPALIPRVPCDVADLLTRV